MLNQILNKKYYLLTAIIFLAIGYGMRPEPKVEIKTVEVEAAKEEKDTSVIIKKVVKPDGTMITTEERVSRFIKDYWKSKRFEKIITSVEPEWIAAISIATSVNHPSPVYGISLGYRVLPKTYLTGTLWPTEARAEASLQHLF